MKLLGYQGPPANLTRGDANLAQLAMTAQFYRQDAVAAPKLTHLGPILGQLRTTLQRLQEKERVTSGRRASRAARW